MVSKKQEVAETVAGVRVYSDGLNAKSKQGLLSSITAISTLMLYCGWPHILLTLVLFSWKRQVLGKIAHLFVDRVTSVRRDMVSRSAHPIGTP